MNRKTLISVLLFLLSASLMAQSQSDLSYLKQADEKKQFLHDHHQRVPVEEYNQQGLNGTFFLNLYKALIAEQLSTGCVYEISCSDFMRISIMQYGFLKGFFLGLDRLSRCNELSIRDVPKYKYDMNHQLIEDDPSAYEF